MVKLNDFNDLGEAATAHWDFCHCTAMDLVRKSFATLYAIFCTLSTHIHVNVQISAYYTLTTILRHLYCKLCDTTLYTTLTGHAYTILTGFTVYAIKKICASDFSRCAHRTFWDYVHCRITLLLRLTMLSSHLCGRFALLV